MRTFTFGANVDDTKPMNDKILPAIETGRQPYLLTRALATKPGDEEDIDVKTVGRNSTNLW